MSNTVERMLTVYDGSTEEMISVFQLSQFDLATFIKQFDVDPATDPQMHSRYSIGPDDASFVLRHLVDEIEFDFQNKAYFIEAIENDLS